MLEQTVAINGAMLSSSWWRHDARGKKLGGYELIPGDSTGMPAAVARPASSPP